MKLLFKTCFLIVCVFGMVSCSSESFLDESTEVEKVQNQFRVPLSEAIRTADKLFGEMEVNQTRTARVVSSIEIKKLPCTRNPLCEIDTMLYLINYADDGGFVLLSADRRLPRVYAISDEGHFAFSDTIENRGLAIFMRSVDNSIYNRIAIYADNNNESSSSATLPTDYYGEYRGKYEIYPPLLNSQMSRLGQGAPWNNYCYFGGIKAQTGCGPLALATFMSLYLWPQTYKGYDIPWTDIRNDNTHPMLAKFISFLWEKDNLDAYPITEYGAITGVGTLTTNFVPTLENMGYTVPYGLQDFDAESVLEVIRKGLDSPKRSCPVLVFGRCDAGGHSWVIDGAMKQDGVVGNGIIAPGNSPIYDPTMPIYLFHCVWGWSGKNNGFFSFDDGSLGLDPYIYGENDEKTLTNCPYNFDTDLQFIGHVIRNSK